MNPCGKNKTVLKKTSLGSPIILFAFLWKLVIIKEKHSEYQLLSKNGWR